LIQSLLHEGISGLMKLVILSLSAGSQIRVFLVQTTWWTLL